MTAPIRQSDDDAVHFLVTDQPIDVADTPEDVVLADDDVVVTVLHEADEPVREILLRADLLGDAAGGGAGAEDQHALFEMRIVGEMVEGDAPRQHRDHEHAQRGHERAGIEDQRGNRDARCRQDNRRRARGLQQTDDELTVRVDDVQVVEIVVIETQLAQRCDERDLPQHRDQVVLSIGRVERSVKVRRQRHRPRDEDHLEAEHRQAPDGDITIEDAQSGPWWPRLGLRIAN